MLSSANCVQYCDYCHSHRRARDDEGNVNDTTAPVTAVPTLATSVEAYDNNSRSGMDSILAILEDVEMILDDENNDVDFGRHNCCNDIWDRLDTPISSTFPHYGINGDGVSLATTAIPRTAGRGNTNSSHATNHTPSFPSSRGRVSNATCNTEGAKKMTSRKQ